MVANKGKLCLGHCLFGCQTRSLQRKDFVCDGCLASSVPLQRVRFTRDASVLGKKGSVMFDVPFRLYRNVFGDYNMLVFRRESNAFALTEKLCPGALLTWSQLPEFFPLKPGMKLSSPKKTQPSTSPATMSSSSSSSPSTEPSVLMLSDSCTWKHGVPFLLNTHDHKLVPKPLGGVSSRLVAPVQHRYACTHCDRTFQQTGNLNSHIRIVHLGQRRFECKICQRKFPRKQNLQYHMRTHTGELPYRCNRCNRGFARKDHLRRHENKPHPYACGVAACKRCFMFKTCVELHKRQKHGIGDSDDNSDDSHQSRLFEDDVDRRTSRSPNPSETSDEDVSSTRSLFSSLHFGSSSAASKRGRARRSGKPRSGETDGNESETEFLSLFSSVRNDPNLLVSGPSFRSALPRLKLETPNASAVAAAAQSFRNLAAAAAVASPHRKVSSIPVALAVPLKIEG